jgi:hypothetical protein
MTTTEATTETVKRSFREVAFDQGRIWFDEAPGGVSMAHALIEDGEGGYNVMALAVPPAQHIPTLHAQARKCFAEHGPLRGLYITVEAWFLPLEHQNDETRRQDWSKDPRAYEVMTLELADEAGPQCFHARITNGAEERTLGAWEPVAHPAHRIGPTWARWGRK